jgi:hypothetical protein
MKLSPPRQTALMGAVRPKPRTARRGRRSGGTLIACGSAAKKNEIHLSFSLHDYMPVIRGLTIFRISEMSAFESLRKG